jgi:HK97 gp10 family phage protein
MADSIEAKLTGDMTSGLDRLMGSAGEAMLRAGGYAGAALFCEEAKRRVPVVEGTILNNIIVKRIEEKSEGAQRQTYHVTVRKGRMGADGDAYYWRWVEYGHSFVRRKAKGVAWKAHRAAMALEYGTSSVPAKPYMRPAYEAMKGVVILAMRARMAAKFKELMSEPT